MSKRCRHATPPSQRPHRRTYRSARTASVPNTYRWEGRWGNKHPNQTLEKQNKSWKLWHDYICKILTGMQLFSHKNTEFGPPSSHTPLLAYEQESLHISDSCASHAKLLISK